MIAIIKKEIKSYFLSPIGYVFIGLFLGLASVFFTISVFLNGSIRFQDMFRPVAVLLTFLVPMLTMRTFVEEKNNGTDILLFTSPKSITEIVLAKFISANIIIVITTIFTLVYYFILKYFGNPDITMVITSILGMLLLGMSYISFGIFVSSIAINQINAAITTVVFFVFSWFLPAITPVFKYFSLINMYDKFLSGVISVTDIFTYITFTIIFILLTIIFLQRRK